MTFDELIKAITTWEPSEDDVKNFIKRMKEADEIFEEKAKRKTVTQEFLRREITI